MDFIEYDRKLDLEVLTELGVRSATDEDAKKAYLDGENKDHYPDDWIVFENFRNGKKVSAKYRSILDKQFIQEKGSDQLLFVGNTGIMDDEYPDDEYIIICEGELDWAAFHDAGFPNVGSAPSSSTRKPDEHGKYPTPKWLSAEAGKLISKRGIIIAVDKDEKGQILREALIDNLDRFRLYEIEFPEGCKDANDVVREYGPKRLAQCVKEMKPIRVDGVRKCLDIMRDHNTEYHNTGWSELDELVRLAKGLVVLTGYSNMGKSQFLRQLLASLVQNKGWHGMGAFFEDDPKIVVLDTIKQMRNFCPDLQQGEAFKRLEEAMVFIDARQARGGGQRTTTAWLLDIMHAQIAINGARFMIIDPWSRIARQTNTRTLETEQINQELQSIQDFAHEHDILAIVSAHPRKPSQDIKIPPTEYDIAGSRSFMDNSDGVWIWHRPDKRGTTGYFRNAKVRNQKDGGKLGWMSFDFDKDSRHFTGGDVLPAAPDWVSR